MSSQPLFNYKINKQGRLPAVQISTEVWNGPVDRLGYLDLVLVLKCKLMQKEKQMTPLNVNNGQFQSQYFVQIYGVLYLFVGVLV